MLERLQLLNVGPAPEIKLEFAPRLNLLTGELCRRPPPKAEAGRDAGDASTMSLTCAPEPSSFDVKVRQKGLSTIAELIGYERSRCTHRMSNRESGRNLRH